MVKGTRIAFIGGGIMAEAIISGILAKGVAAANDITVGEPMESRRSYLASQYGVSAISDNREVAEGAGIVVLAVKPQQLDEVMDALRGLLNDSQAALSIVAGATIKRVSQGLRHSAVIRVMPNTPGQVGEGMSVWTTAPEVSQQHQELTQRILKTLGEEIYVSDEKYLDMATALSASGPAYVFLFLESLIDAGVYVGLPRDMAQALALQTVLGSAALAKKSGRHPAELRNMVTSPGGTTAEALLTMEEGGLRGTIINAVIAAHEKAMALGEKE